MIEDISKPTDPIAAYHERWKRNRDFIEGEYAVRAVDAGYLPRLPVHELAKGSREGEAAYRAYIQRSPYFPAASRILDGLKGMVGRKPSNFKCADQDVPYFQTMTRQGWSYEDLAERSLEEAFTTNFGATYIDYTPKGANKKSRTEAKLSKDRPWVSFYRAESILEVTPGVIDNELKLVRVRVLDNANTVRELLLDDGAYTVILHHKTDGVWKADDPIAIDRNGRKMDTIPFRIVSTRARATEPGKSVMDDVVSLNAQLYLAQAGAENLRFYYANPMFFIKGVEESNMKIAIGQIMFFPSHTQETPVELGFNEASGVNQGHLDDNVKRIKDELSIIGSRILAPDTKAGVESAEALTIRKSSENAVLASQVNTVSRVLQETFSDFADWAGLGEVEFAFSTDFIPNKATPQERAAVVSEWLSGLYSHEMALNLMKDEEVLPATLDVEQEILKAQSEKLAADRPLYDPQSVNPGEEDNGGE